VVLVLLIIFMVIVPLALQGLRRRHPSYDGRRRARAGRVAQVILSIRAHGLPHPRQAAGEGCPPTVT